MTQNRLYRKEDLLMDILGVYYAFSGEDVIQKHLSIKSKHQFIQEKTYLDFFLNDEVGELEYMDYRAVLHVEGSLEFLQPDIDIHVLSRTVASPDTMLEDLYVDEALKSRDMHCYMDIYHHEKLLLKHIDTEQGEIIDAFAEGLFKLVRMAHGNYDEQTMDFLAQSKIILGPTQLQSGIKITSYHPFEKDEANYPNHLLLQIESNFMMVMIRKESDKSYHIVPYYKYQEGQFCSMEMLIYVNQEERRKSGPAWHRSKSFRTYKRALQRALVLMKLTEEGILDFHTI